MATITKYRSYHVVKQVKDLSALSEALSLQEHTITDTEIKPDEVLVKVRAASLQYHDVSLTTGADGMPLIPNIIPLSDLAGEVVFAGSNVSDWKAGDRVAANVILDYIDGVTNTPIMMSTQGTVKDGALTEYKVLPAHSLVRVPAHLTFEEASTLPCSALTAWNAFNGPVPLHAGQTVLIQGTGGVSIFALQFALALGAKAIVTSSSDEKLEIAKKLGATHVINYKTTPNWAEEVTKLTNGQGVDHVIEIGGSGTLLQSIGAASYGGWIQAIGFTTHDETFVNITRLAMWKSLIIRGVFIGSVKTFNDMNKFIAEHKIKPVIDKVFTFDDAKSAYEYISKQKHIGKIVITLGQA